jgi:alkylated DNA repair dioxygenase AlkB
VKQEDLFAESARPLLGGFEYRPEFIDAAEEAALLETIRTLPFHEARYKEYEAKRRIVSYGGSYDFDRNELLPAEPAPQFLFPLRERIAAWADQPAEEFAHVLIAEYSEGTQLGWHRDVPSFELVAGVSLLGRCRMRFRPYPTVKAAPGKAKPRSYALQVEPRSAYIMRGESRWDWQHSIPPTPELRYSITFRTLRR